MTFRVGNIVRVLTGGYGVSMVDVHLFQHAEVIRLEKDGRAKHGRVILKGDRSVQASVRADHVELVSDRPIHVHSEVIIAWANGAKVQASPTGQTGSWLEASKPAWHATSFYRVLKELDTEVIDTIEKKIVELQDQLALLLKESRV